MKPNQQNSLTPAHRQHLQSEGFTVTQIQQLIELHGVRSLTQSEALAMGFKVWDGQQWQSSSGILMPFTDEFAQLRCDTPITRANGKSAKYITQFGNPSQAFIPESCKVITEGFKDSMAGTLHGGIPTGAIAGVSHYRKALLQGGGYTTAFDSDGWINPQVFVNLIHMGKWLNGRVALLPAIKDNPHAGLCEYFKAGQTPEDYRALIDSAQRPEDLLQEWPNHWEEVDLPKIPRLARMAACLAVLYLSPEEGNAYIRRIADRYSKAGIRARELAAFAKKWRDRRQYKKRLPALTRQYTLIKNRFSKRLRFNELKNQVELDQQPFDLGLAKVELTVTHGLELRAAREDVADLVTKIAKENPYHPVVEYLEKVSNRHGTDTTILDALATQYFGATDPIHQTQLRRFLIAAVARAYEPGCKQDCTLILQGMQGVGKSSFWRTLASEEWFDDSLGNVSEKDEVLKLHQVWFVEWAELEIVFKRRDLSQVKAFLTCAVDQVRRPYGRSVETLPRRGVICGSTNEDEFLSDSTGNRRFWVVPVQQSVNLKKLREERDLIWAAAVALYKSSEQWWLTDAEEKLVQTIREQFQFHDPWHDVISSYIEGKELVSTSEILYQVLQFDINRQDRAVQMRVAAVLRRCGWGQLPHPQTHDGKRQRVWTKKIKNKRESFLHKKDVQVVQEPEMPTQNGFSDAQPQHILKQEVVQVVQSEPIPAQPAHPCTTSIQKVVQAEILSNQEVEGRCTTCTSNSPEKLFLEKFIFSPGDRVGKKNKRGWVGTVKSDPANGWIDVLWEGDKKADSVKVEELRAIAPQTTPLNSNP